MITFSNGHTFQYMVASGALGFSGRGWPWERPLVWLGLIKPELFTVVTKTLTYQPRRGNLRWFQPWTWLPWSPWSCVRFLPGGAVNKVGLTNPGLDWWCRQIGPRLNFQEVPLVVSIAGNERELVAMAKRLRHFRLVGLEVNLSCPNTNHCLPTTEEVRDSLFALKLVRGHQPLIVKVSVDQDYLAIARELEGIAEALALNSVPWSLAYPSGAVSPLQKLEERVGGGGGGVSGRPAQARNWAAVEVLAKQGSLPVIAPSVMEFADLARVRALGAEAVSFGAIHLRTPWRPTAIVEKENSL